MNNYLFFCILLCFVVFSIYGIHIMNKKDQEDWDWFRKEVEKHPENYPNIGGIAEIGRQEEKY